MKIDLNENEGIATVVSWKAYETRWNNPIEIIGFPKHVQFHTSGTVLLSRRKAIAYLEKVLHGLLEGEGGPETFVDQPEEASK